MKTKTSMLVAVLILVSAAQPAMAVVPVGTPVGSVVGVFVGNALGIDLGAALGSALPVGGGGVMVIGALALVFGVQLIRRKQKR